MNKCCHQVYIPAWSPDEGKSPYCSGCYSPAEIDKLTETKPMYFPKGRDVCPKCGENKRFFYVNDWDFTCPRCGYNALDAHDDK